MDTQKNSKIIHALVKRNIIYLRNPRKYPLPRLKICDNEFIIKNIKELEDGEYARN